MKKLYIYIIVLGVLSCFSLSSAFAKHNSEFRIIPYFTNGHIPTSSVLSGARCNAPGNTAADNTRLCTGDTFTVNIPGNPRGENGTLVTGTNCHGFTDSELTSSQTGSICTAIMRMEPIIKNPITVTVEAFQAPQGLSLGVSTSVLYVAPTDSTGVGYDRVISALKTSELKEQKSFNIVKYLPKYADLQVRIQQVCSSFGYKPQTIEMTRAQARLLNLDLTTLTALALPATVTLRTPDGQAAVDGSFVTSSLLGGVPGYADFNPYDGIGLETLYGPLSIRDWNAINVIYNPDFTINTALSTVPPGFDRTVFDFTGIAQHELTHLLGLYSRLTRWATTNCSTLATGPGITAMDVFAIEEKKLNLLNKLSDMKNAVLMLDTERDSGLRALSGSPNSPTWYGGCVGTKNAEGFAATCSHDPTPIGEAAPFESNRVFVYDVRGRDAKFIPLAGGGGNFGDAGDGTDPSHIRMSVILNTNISSLTPANFLLPSTIRWYRPDVCPRGITGKCIPTAALMEPGAAVHKVFGDRTGPSNYTINDLIIMDLMGLDIDYKAAGFKSPK